MAMDFEHELAAAREAAVKAGEAVMGMYASFEAIADAPAEISTEADRRSQEIILEHLRGQFPNDAYCAEEASESLNTLKRQAPRIWIIDPIDGTRGFAKKNGEFSIMIGLVEKFHVRMGVVLEPARQRLTYAVKGEGCWRLDADGVVHHCQVSAIADWSQARLVRSWSEQKHVNPTISACGQRLYTYSAGVKFVLVARGEADAYTSTYTGFNSWDVCAGQILVEEAGGQVQDARGEPILYRQDGTGKIAGTAASNGLLQQHARAAVGP